jgi:predicted phosphodiesterase
VNNRTWTEQEISDAHDLSDEDFLAQYPDRTSNGLRFKRKKTRDRPRTQTDGTSLTIRAVPSDADLQELFTTLELAGELRENVIMTQESTTFRVPGNKPIGIAFLGDIHAGNQGVLYRQLKIDLQTIADTDGLYVAGMGDYIDNYKPQAKSGTGLYHGLFSDPNEQLAYITMRFRIAKGKWLCLAEGNHDAWDAKWAGIDRLPALAQDLETAYFSERGGTIFVDMDDMRYAVVVKHDYRGKSQLNKGNSQRHMFDHFPEWVNADVICLGHLHEPFMEQSMRKGRSVTYFRSGTYKVHDSWAEAQGYTPSYGVPVVVLYPHERKLVPFPGENFADAVAYLRQIRAS